MITVISSKTGKYFMVETDTIHEVNGVLRASFVMLFVNKIILSKIDDDGKVKKTASYEYPTEFFRDLNLIKVNQISSQVKANPVETDLYQRIQGKKPLTKEIREYLRMNYLVEG